MCDTCNWKLYINQLKKFLIDQRYENFLQEINEEIKLITETKHITPPQVSHFYSLQAVKGDKVREESFDPVAVIASNTELLSDYIYVPDAGMFYFNKVEPYKWEKALLKDPIEGYPESYGGRWKLLHPEEHHVKLLPYIEKNKVNSINEMQKFHQLKTLEIDPMNKQEYFINTRSGTLLFVPEMSKVHYLDKTFETARRDKVSVMLNTIYKEDAACPLWEKFIYEIMDGDLDLMDLLQEYCGNCLLPNQKFEKSLILLGSGANGKSTFINVWENVIGEENVSHVSMDELTNQFARITMYGKLMNMSSEMDASEVQNSSYFKSIISGDSIRAEFKFKSSISFKPFCKLIFAMNSMPKVKDREIGFFRKFIFIPFNKCFLGNPDRELSTKLKAEAPGILSWAIRGLERLYANQGFTKSKASDRVLEIFRKENNSALSYIMDSLEVSPDPENEFLFWDIVYEDYCNVVKKNGGKSFGANTFYKEIQNFFPANVLKMRKYIDGKRENVITGIRWKD